MANVAHKNLTGVNLHEPKGVATATSGQLYVANGSGSGAWTTPTEPFYTQYLNMQNQQTAGVAGTPLSTGSWQTRVINATVTNTVTSATLTANVISLPAGTYYCDAWVTLGGTATAQGNSRSLYDKLRLYNSTASTTLLRGAGGFSEIYESASATQVRRYDQFVRPLSGRFTLAGTSNVVLQQALTITGWTITEGHASAWDTEVYADIRIWKIA